ncbi:hypothetical protein EIP86_004532 [Pleurotus ostreatoroseus]|nr:hypothetical protein EIP86_004532 [Pleurotus ostreatoroseus]
MTNTGDETLMLLNDPRGPLSKIPAETFSIVHESDDAPQFVGVKAKYEPLNAMELGREDTFTVLTPGESISIEHELSAA